MKFKHWLILLLLAWFLFGGGWYIILGLVAVFLGGA